MQKHENLKKLHFLSNNFLTIDFYILYKEQKRFKVSFYIYIAKIDKKYRLLNGKFKKIEYGRLEKVKIIISAKIINI